MIFILITKHVHQGTSLFNQKRFQYGLVLIPILIASGISDISGAAFNAPSTLINIPIVQSYKANEIEFGVGGAMYEGDHYDFDLMLNYAITNEMILGLTMVNSEKFITNFHSNFSFGSFAAAAGMQLITTEKAVSYFDEFSSDSENTMAIYIVSSLSLGWGKYHLGFGTNGFRMMP